MTDLNAMWDALARYQPYADKDGHGESWRVMCSERTQEVAEAAAAAAWETLGGWADAAEAADAAGNAERADWLEWAKDALYWSDRTIKHIEAAIKAREPELSDTEPEPFDLNEALSKELFRTAFGPQPEPSNIEPTSNDDGQAQTVDAQHSEIEQLKAERDAAVRELELTTVERNRAHRACEQISVRLHAAEAERDALREALRPFAALLCEHHQRMRDDQPIVGLYDAVFTVGDMRRAKAAIDAVGGDV